MIKVDVIYSCHFNTWNVMCGKECIFYGDIMSVERWLLDNKQEYEEDERN